MEPFELIAGPLVLDQPTSADVPLITEYCQDPIFEAYMAIPWPYEQKHAEFFVDEYVPRGWSTDTEVTWALRRDGEFLGVVGLRKNTTIGFWLGAPHRGSGYMPLAVAAVVDWAFESGWVPEVRWEAIVGNQASLTVARKAGFTYTGVAPAKVTGRDGSHPDSWQAVLRPSDSRNPKPGWPA